MVQYYKRKVIYSNGSVHYKYYKLYSNGRMVKVLKYEYMKGQCAKSKTGGVPPLDLTKGYQGDSFQKYYIEYMSTDNINSTKYTGIEAKIAMEFERVYVDLYNKNIMNETGCNMDNYRKASDIDKAAMNELNKKKHGPRKYKINGQTDAGRWLRVIFEDRGGNVAKIITGWDI